MTIVTKLHILGRTVTGGLTAKIQESALRGRKESRGRKGPAGHQGEPGPQGPSGTAGAQGPKGDTGDGYTIDTLFSGAAGSVGSIYNLSKPITDYRELRVEIEGYNNCIKPFEPVWMFSWG